MPLRVHARSPSRAHTHARTHLRTHAHTHTHVHTQACRGWSGALFFSELNIDALNSGVSGFLLQHKKLPEYTKPFQLYDKLKENMVSFQNSLPLLGMLKNDAMRPRHWKKLLPTVEINPGTFTLAQLFSLNLAEMSDFVDEVVTEASKEVQIEKGIEEVETNWKAQELTLYKYERDGADRGQCLRATEDITLILDDNLMNLSSMSASKFVGPFLSQVQAWEKRLSLIGETLDAWMTVQKKWQYLESIFIGSDDIKQQLPDAAKKFDVSHSPLPLWARACACMCLCVRDREQCVCACVHACVRASTLALFSLCPDAISSNGLVKCLLCMLDASLTWRGQAIDKAWHKTMQETAKEKNVVKACCVDGRLEMFQEMATSLDKCQKSLSDFLDSKRNSFPRFFFISDDEMLSVLGSSDVTAVQEHCLKMFDNCQALTFKRQDKFVGGMRSPEGESYEFRTLTSTDGPVEFWMTDVVKEMVVSLRAIMKEGIFHYPKMSRLKWIDENLGMVSILF